MTKLTFQQIEHYLYAQIQNNIPVGYLAGTGLERVNYTLKLLGDPQEKYKVIHVAGTSGKGSTVTLISSILKTHGFVTGTTLSPHLVDIRERIQIQNQLLTKKKFADYFNELFPVFQKVGESEHGPLSYFELLICLAYYTFFKEKVDYVVIETGLGGTYDATNSIKSIEKIAVIGPIGYDHTKILGKTLEEIAANKAGIIGQKQTVVFLDSQKSISDLIINKANQCNATYYPVKLAEVFKKTSDTSIYFHYSNLSLGNLSVQNLVHYQIKNLVLALCVLAVLSQRDAWTVSQELVQQAVKNYRFAGRFEETEFHGRKIIFDGAHNPQKMHAFINSLTRKYPKEQFDFLIACKQDKDIAKMLSTILPYAKSVYLTKFRIVHQDIKLKSYDGEFMRGLLIKLGFKGKIVVKNDAREALHAALSTQAQSRKIIVTGSLYLVGQIKQILDSTKS